MGAGRRTASANGRRAAAPPTWGGAGVTRGGPGGARRPLHRTAPHRRALHRLQLHRTAGPCTAPHCTVEACTACHCTAPPGLALQQRTRTAPPGLAPPAIAPHRRALHRTRGLVPLGLALPGTVAPCSARPPSPERGVEQPRMLAPAGRCHAAERSGCVVSVSGPAEAAEAGPWSCSGVVLSWEPAVVLCHGAVFAPFLREGPAAWSRREALQPGALRPGTRAHVLGPGGRPRQHEARLLALVPCAAFAEALAGAAVGRAEPWRCSGGEPAPEPRALGWFGLLRAPGLDGGGGGGWTPRGAAAALRKGQALVACGSPFGALCPDLFLNTLSAGVLSNAAGPRNALLLTDARCLPGTEGGGVFTAPEPRLVGVVAAPLCGAGGEWLGLALVCSLDAILCGGAAAILEQAGAAPPPPSPLPSLVPAPGELPRALLRRAALVQCGAAWGSGALLGPRLLLTCRHVLQPGARIAVRTAASRAAALAGQLVFATEEESPFDVAVVELEHGVPGFVPPRMASTFCPGEEVSVVSFGVLGGACGPSVTAGVLSAVIAVAGRPVMLQTTCAVHGGSSGGPLFSTRTGQLLGIVASNAKDTGAGATYPHLNFSVPITALRPALRRYLRTGDAAAFAALNGAAEGARQVWRLQRAPPGAPLSKL